MDANTDPTSVQFTDEKLEFDQAANASGSDDGGFGFDQSRKPVLTIGDTTLTEGVDYSLDKYQADSFKITFKNSSAIKAAIGKTDVQVKYWTVSDKTSGTYKNTAKVKYNGKTTSADASYDVENTNLVAKTGKMSWDKDFDWSQINPNDTTKGAWVATWQVTVNEDNDQNNGVGKTELHGQPIVVTDTLPEGMSYVPGGKYKVQAGNWPGPVNGKLDDVRTTDANGNTVFTIPTKDVIQNEDGSDKAYAVLTYSTAAKGTGQEVDFTNKATADSGKTHFGEDTSTVTGSSKVIDKSAAQVKDVNHVRYTIKVNPEGADLVKDSDTVTLTDVMDAEGTFIPTSLKVINSNTGATLVVPVKVERVTDGNGSPTTKLTLTLPDSTPVTVTYDVKPNGKPGDKVNLSNTATLDGVTGGESINKKDWTVTNPSAGTEGAAGTITVTKTDASDLSRTLPGAKFALYQVDMGKLSGNAVTFDEAKAAATKVGDDVTTNANGVATFGSADKPLATNTLYFFVETEAPKASNGVEYEINPDPTYFMLPGTDAAESSAALAKAKAFGLPVSDATSYNVYDARKPQSVKGSVTLGKQLTGRAWKDTDAFTFELAADAADSKGVSEAEVKAAMPANTTATVKKSGDGADGSISKFSFGDFTFSKAGTYVYTVKETGKGGDGVTLDDRTATVTFDVAKNASGNLEVRSGQPMIAGVDDHNGVRAFKNTYTPTPATTSGTIKVQKDLSGRAWKQGDSFEFRLAPTAQNPDAPLPAGAKDGYAALTVTDGEVHAFGDITYTKAGTYEYDLYEHTPTANDGEQAIPGIDYSNALYHVTVKVADDGNGKLSIDPDDGVVVTKASNDNGSDYKNPEKPVAFNKAWFTNYFDAESINFSLLATKKYEDRTGSKPLTDGMFSFTLSADGKAPMPEGKRGGSVVAAVKSDGTVSFPAIKYTGSDDDGKTYTYTLKENAPAGAKTSADGKTATLNGMTYDLTTYTVKVVLSTTTDGDKPVLKQSTTILDQDGNKVAAGKLDNGRPVFSNTYTLNPVDASIAGRKTLTGRDMDADETFTFSLGAATDGTDAAKAASAGLKDDSIVLGGDAKASTLEATVKGAKDDAPAGFSFDGLHFTKPGTFKFAVTETGNVKQGTQKDDHVGYVTVKVVDNGQGGLKVASTAYDNATAKTDADKALTDKAGFTNTYAPEGFTFFLLHKNLTAASGVASPKLTAGKFSFGLYQGDGTDGKTPIQTKTNTAPAGGETSGRVTFNRIAYTPASLAQAVKDGYATYNDKAKTWTVTYTVAELDDSGNPVVKGVTKDGIAYDATTRKVVVTVADAGNGTLKTSYIVSDGDPATSTDADSDEAAFDNVYSPAPATAELHAQKTLSGRDWQNGDSFTFKLEAVGGTLAVGDANVAKNDVPMPDGARNGVLTHDATDGDAFGFGQMTYTKAGTYTYNISEEEPADPLPGVSYSTDMYRATVTVTDDGKGQLTSAVAMVELPKASAASKQALAKAKKVKAAQDADPVAVIANTYDQLSQDWSPTVRKTYTDLSGANKMQANQFTFQLEGLDGAPMPNGATGGTVTTTNNANGIGAFKAITFTDKDLGENGAAKTYQYRISEVKGTAAGMTYDTTVYTAAVTVSLENGVLKVTPVITKADGTTVTQPTFANTYQPTAVDVRLKAHKTLNGATLKDKQFSFNLYDGLRYGENTADPLQTKTNADDGDVTFDKLTFDKAGTYQYSIREVVPEGALGNVKDGVTYGDAWNYVEVKVTLDKATGTLKATVTDANTNTDTTEITNTYDATGAATLTAKKAFTNEDGSSRAIPQGAFTFQLHEGATKDGKLLQTKPAAADGSVAFSPIAYQLSDLGGAKSKTFTYTVNEVIPADKDKLPGVAYDTAAHTYTVTVKDNGNGKLATTVKVDGKSTPSQPTFTNTYSAAGSTAIAGTKQVKGDDGKDYTADFGGKFTFTLTGKDGAPIHVAGDDGKTETKDSLTAQNTAAGAVDFGTLQYTLADLKGVTPGANGSRSKAFTYEVKESGTTAGVTNDATAVKTFTVTVTDDGTGALKVATSPVDTAKLFAFENTYAASAKLDLTGTKTMTGRKLTDADKYTFNVYEGTAANGTPVSTGTSDSTGKITFDKSLGYTLKDLGDHTYTVVESEANLPGGVTAVTRTHTFTVNVADKDHNGTLTLTTNGLDGQNGGSGLAFENNYTTTDSTPIEFKGVKLLDDGDYATTLDQLKGRFAFTLTPVDGAPLHVLGTDGKTVTDKRELTAQNDEAGNIDLGKVVYRFADLGGQTERTFTYRVAESGDVAGVTNDKALTRTFTVTIKDNGDGTMSATTDPATGALFSFENTYSAGTVTDSFDFTKTLDGRALKDGEFTFTLTGAQGADGATVPMPKDAKDGVATAKNSADGTISFGEITYAKPGTYAYTVREKADKLGGVTYDDTAYTVVVTVVDNHDGTMSATHEISLDGHAVKPADAVFSNTYAPTPTTATFSASKTLKGRALKDGEFTFELRDANGRTVQTAKNAANGKVTFTPVEFTKPGEYRYTIRETVGNAEGIRYDRTVYEAKVTVTDRLDGTMSATVAYSSGLFGGDHTAPVFENTYTPVVRLSKTGSDAAGVLALAMLLLGGGLAVTAVRRRSATAGAPIGRHRR
ncbi:Spy0128 family protein [Bifidobacterium pluvialisilvae]|uniref:Spy0128 family protein n=1 Tax=Bifidobacterium pluvialisilvae TaxID=2834436 RepID=UPI0027E2626B|nr:FctA domain-containing protein [Bifidobacterium pluvialisilvae]